MTFIRRIAVQHGMRWQDATLADVYPLLCDVAERMTPAEETATAKRLVSLGVLKEIDDDGRQAN